MAGAARVRSHQEKRTNTAIRLEEWHVPGAIAVAQRTSATGALPAALLAALTRGADFALAAVALFRLGVALSTIQRSDGACSSVTRVCPTRVSFRGVSYSIYGNFIVN